MCILSYESYVILRELSPLGSPCDSATLDYSAVCREGHVMTAFMPALQISQKQKKTVLLKGLAQEQHMNIEVQDHPSIHPPSLPVSPCLSLS